MFNGIIKKTGKIKIIKKKGNNCYLQLITNIKFKKNDIGMSISCSGACLTLERYYKNLVQSLKKIQIQIHFGVLGEFQFLSVSCSPKILKKNL